MNALVQPQRRLRPMTTADLDRVAAIERRAYGFPWTRGNFVDSLAAGYVAEVLIDDDGIETVGYFVALVGVDEMHLLNLTVAPPWQGQGLGRLLLDNVRERCRELRLATLWLEVRAGNHRARQLYLRYGFAEVGLRKSYYPAGFGSREDAVLMSVTVVGAGGGDGVQ